jgi:hypothetical protein
MKRRLISREEAESCYTRELAGEDFHVGHDEPGTITGIRLPDRPVPGGVAGKGYLPLTYEYQVDGLTHTLITREGPEVDEMRAFLRATLWDYEIDQRLELWFENDASPVIGCDCGCGC